jgi:hypothetical protein
MAACGEPEPCVPVLRRSAAELLEVPMALYRFLFAPVLLAVAVVSGPRERTSAPPPAPAAVEAPAPAAAAARIGPASPGVRSAAPAR